MPVVGVQGGQKLKINTAASTSILPTGVSSVSHTLSDFHWLIHGPMKIGKTTFAMSEPDVLLLTFDPPQISLPILQKHVDKWDTFIKILEALEARAASNNYPYKRVVIDGADICFRRCQEWVEKKLVIPHVSEGKWSSGWDMLDANFAGTVDRFMRLPGGSWWICHSTWKEADSRSGSKIDVLRPLMKPRAEEVIAGRCDGTMAMCYSGPNRIMVIVGDEKTGAGHRLTEHYLTPDKKVIKEIYMGVSPTQAWENFQLAFNNRQTYTTMAERRTEKK
jgi:hypothetical protein